MLKKIVGNIKKTFKNKKGDIALIGIIITITVTLFIQGYLDTTSANYILDEAQSMIDLTALTTLESSIDTEGLRYERMTIRPYNYDYEKAHYNQIQNGEGNIDFTKSILTGDSSGAATPEQKEVKEYSIWLDGTNAYYIQTAEKELAINNRLRENFDFYMQNFLWNQLQADGVNILSYDVTAFTGTLSYDNWGINRKYHVKTTTYEGLDNSPKTKTTNDYIYMPQATIDAMIQLTVDVDPTFTTAFYSYTLYNAQKTSTNEGVTSAIDSTATNNNYNVGDGTYLVNSGFDSNNNLVLTIRVVCRQTFY